jgi:hypothetical protein
MFLTLICTGIFFRDAIVSATLERYLKGYCHQCFGPDATFYIPDIEKKEGAWIVKKPVIIKKNDQGLQNHFSADQITIEYSLSLLSRQLHFDIKIDNLQWKILDQQSILEKFDLPNMQWLANVHTFSNSSPSAFSFFHPHCKLEIDQGMLTLHTPENPSKQLPFHFQGDVLPSLSGCLTTWEQTKHASAEWIELTFLPSADLTPKRVHVNCHAMSCTFAYDILQTLKPSLGEWKASDGTINGEFTINLPKDQNMYLEGDLHLNQFTFNHATMQLQGEIPAAHLHFVKPFQLEPVSPMALGKITLSTPASLQIHHGDHLWGIQNIAGDVVFQQNCAELSFQGTCCQGQKKLSVDEKEVEILGDIKLSLSTAERIVSIDFTGQSQNLIPLLPEQFVNAVRKKFPQNSISIAAKGEIASSRMNVEGTLAIANTELTTSDSIRFDFTLEKTKGSSLAPFFITEGRFHAIDLPLDKYASPFIFPKEQLQLSGRGICLGLFNRQGLTLQYQAKDLLLDSDYFTLKTADVDSGHHHFEFGSGKHSGSLLLGNAEYLEKNSGLLFTDVQAKVAIEPEHIHAADVETFCKGMYFAGAVDLDFKNNSKGIVDIDILSHTMVGSFSQFQTLLTDLKQPLIPIATSLEGNMGLHRNNASLHFSLRPDGVQTAVNVQGSFTDGTTTCPDLNLALQELNFNFEYDPKANTLDCSDIQGTLLVGSPKHFDEYMLAGDYVRFIDYKDNHVQFDLWVGDKNRDILRLVGRTQPVYISSSEDPHIDVSLDHELSHFGNVHPTDFSLVVKKWSEVRSFYLRFAFQLDTLLKDIQRFSKTGLLFLSQGLLKELNTLKTAQGDFDVICRYKHDTAQLLYEADGHDVSIGPYQYKKCLLKGKKSGNQWGIEQLQLDDLSFAADVTKTEKELAIDFLGIRYGKDCLLGLEGKYSLENHQFNGKVNLLENDLARLHKWPKLHHLNSYRLKGDVRATGRIHAEWLDHNPKWQWEMEMNAAVRGCEVDGIKFQDVENILCTYRSDQGISLNNIHTAVKDHQAVISLEKLKYNPSNRALDFQGLDFNISSTYLPEIINALQKHIPEEFYHKPIALLAKSASEGNLEGSLNLTTSPLHKTLSLKLKEGRYKLMNTEYDLKDSVIEWDPYELRMSTTCLNKERPYQISMNSALPAFKTGEVCITDKNSEWPERPLKIQWQSEQNGEIVISSARGFCAGMRIDLQRPRESSSKMTHLVGNVLIDANEKMRIIDQIDALASLNLKGKYYFTGEWFFKEIDSLNLSKLTDSIHFKGEFESNHCEWKGHELEQLSGKLECSPQTILSHNFSINDVAGSLHAEKIELSRNPQNEWIVTIPSASATFRPSKLRGLNSAFTAKHANFMVSDLELKDFSGNLFKPETYQGKGIAYCQNLPKQGSQDRSTLSADQRTDKESNLDVELALLRPECGSIHYAIDQEKVYLTLLEDVYSFGKHSNFYLFEDDGRSYIDFNGDISIHARIKQRNLLLKFAELFTVSISGSLNEPTYTFNRNRKKDL